MRYWLERDLTPVNLAETAIPSRWTRTDLYPRPRRHRWLAIHRAGSIPTPNLFTGMQNVHGPLEYI